MSAAIATVEDAEGPGLVQSLLMFPLIAVLTVLAFAGVGAGIAFLPAVSVAEAKIGLTDTKGNVLFLQSPNSALDLARYTGGRARFSTSNQVLGTAARSLQPSVSVGELRQMVTATPATDADLITITAKAASPRRAGNLANAVARAYQTLSKQDTDRRAANALANLQQQVDVARLRLAEETKRRSPLAAADRDLVAALNERASEVRLTAALFGSGVSYLSMADPAGAAGGRSLPKYLAVSVLLGLTTACFITWVLADRAHRRRQVSEVAAQNPSRLPTPMNGSVRPGSAQAITAKARPTPTPRTRAHD